MKYCLITHIADPDGAFPIILSKLVLENVECFSCEQGEVDSLLEQIIQKDYDTIYIVDLNMTEDMAKKINENDVLKNKIKVFDHHESVSYLNKYPFIQVVVEANGQKECGTTLYLNHLKKVMKNSILENNALNFLVELVRENDTFDFKEELENQAIQFRNLYDIYGREKYIEHFTEYILTHDTFELTGIEKEIIEIEEARSKRYIEEKLKHMKKATIDGVKVGIVFAEQNRSMLGHAIVDNNPDIDIAVVINVDRSISYRACKENIDTNILATVYGGGGHKHASGSPLPTDLQEKIVEYLFKKVEWENLWKSEK